MLIRPPDTTTSQLLKPSHNQKSSLKLQTKLLSPLLVGQANANSKSAAQLQRPTTTSQNITRNPNPGSIPKRLLSPRSKKINLIVKNALANVEEITDEKIQVPSNVYQFRQFVPQRSKSPDSLIKIKHKPGSFTQRTMSKAENSKPLKTEFDAYDRDSPFHIRDHGEYNLPGDGLSLSKRVSSDLDSPRLKHTPQAAHRKHVILEYEKVRDIPYPIIQSATPEIVQGGSSVDNLPVGRPLLSPKIKKIVNPNANNKDKDMRASGTRSKKKTRNERNERNTPSVENNEGKVLSVDKDNREQKKIKEIPMSQAMFRMKEFKRVKNIVSKRKAMNSGGQVFVANDSQSKFFSMEKQFPNAQRQEDQRRIMQMYMVKKNEEYLRYRLFPNEKTALIQDNSLESLDRDSKETPDIGESIDRTKYLSRHRTDMSQDYTEHSAQQRLRTLPNEDKVEMSFSGPVKGNRKVFARQGSTNQRIEEDNNNIWENLRKSHVLNLEKRKSSSKLLKTEPSSSTIPEVNKLDMTKFLKILDKQQKPTLLTSEGGSTALSTERKREAETKDNKTLPTVVLQKQKSEREFLVAHYESTPQQDVQKFKLVYPSKKKIYVKPSTPSRGMTLGQLLGPSTQETMTILSKDSLKTPLNATNKLTTATTKVMEELHEISQISIKNPEICESFEFENLVK